LRVSSGRPNGGTDLPAPGARGLALGRPGCCGTLTSFCGWGQNTRVILRSPFGSPRAYERQNTA
ncbi:MAG: hypothetical protein ACM3XM_08790, partial [Mycobacterium leprae]